MSKVNFVMTRIPYKKILCGIFIVIGILLLCQDVEAMARKKARKRTGKKTHKRESVKASKFEFIISIADQKDQYKKDDHISISMKLKNKGKNPAYINARFFVNSEESPEDQREVFFIVKPISGKKLECIKTRSTGFPRTAYFRQLEGGDEIEAERKPSLKYLFDIPEGGIYEIQGIYQNVYGPEIGIDAFSGKIKSNIIKITIVE